MPQIEIEYSANLPVGDALRGLGLALHHELAPIADTDLDSFKTRLSRLDHVVVGDGAAHNGMVHLDIRLLSGRSDDVKQKVGQAALALLRAHLEGALDAFCVQFTVEIHDLDRGHYHKHVTSSPKPAG